MRFVKGRWDFDRETTLSSFHFACCDQQVVIRNHADEFTSGHVIRLKPQWIDHDLKHLITLPGKACLEYGIHAFEAILQVFSDFHQSPFGDFACEVYDHNRKFRKVDFIDGIVISTSWKDAFRFVHRIPDICQNLGLIPAEFKFERDACVAL